MITPEQALDIYHAGADAVVENICELSRKFDLQQKRVEALESKVAQLLKNSSNSSKPPSSDITKPKAGKRGRGKRKIGAQPGHPRHERPLFTQAEIDKSRGSKVLIDVLGEEFNGSLGCNYFSAYHKYMNDFNITVQFCIAHLIRDIKYLTGLRDAETKAYGKKLLGAVKDMFKVIHLSACNAQADDRENLDTETFKRAMENAREKIMAAALDNVPSQLDENGKELKRGPYNMANRFRKNGEAYFVFITTPGCEPTNNLAEQAVRFVVIDRHITQGTRGEKGRKTNERLWTVLGTCALQGRSAFEFIFTAVHAHFHGEPEPSLLPAMG